MVDVVYKIFASKYLIFNNKMDYFLIMLFMICIVAIIFFWHVSHKSKYLPENEQLFLNTNQDKLASEWYKHNIKHSVDLNVDDYAIACKFLKRIYDIDADPNTIVIGNNLQSQYQQLTGSMLDNKSFFDIRATVGKDGEIAIINDNSIVKTLRRNNSLDLTDVSNIMDSDLDGIAKDFFTLVLDNRWDRISQLNDQNVLNRGGSYLYYDSSSSDDNVVVFGNVVANNTNQGARINLLCNDIEFETLMNRWKVSLEVLV